MRKINWIANYRIVMISLFLFSGPYLQGEARNPPADAAMNTSLLKQETLQTAFEHLQAAEVLESAYIGKAGAPSENLQDLRIIIKSSEAEPTLFALYEKGNLTAKMYAIIGLQLLQKKDQAQALITDAQQFPEEKVTTIEGCLVFDRTVQEVLKAIEDGYYVESFGETR
ncbi:MAG TPA: hypothetical protein VE954_02825 [Oligoflexus sp.]|uniref:hypothetical protein n=1 Tax=Oligoflexus sp. TaxID=1971216 RepID=UPI002D695A3F|nr:hypothetical protein [Oligoflexus sp.]HYX32020.1 hypothetical protein [Oligoflexus sp.]